MTIVELEAFLKREKEIAERELGCDMCQKYARCLFCAPTESNPCAHAHNRYEVAMRHKALRAPSWLLPEPPFSEDVGYGDPAPYRAPAPQPAPKKAPANAEEEVVTVSDILSEQNPELKIPYLSDIDLSVLEDGEPSRRAPRGVIARSIPTADAQRVLTIRRKHS